MEVFNTIKKLEFYQHEFKMEGNVYCLKIDGFFYKLLWNLDVLIYLFFAVDLILSVESISKRIGSFWLTLAMLIGILIAMTYVIRYIFRYEIRKYICRKKKVSLHLKHSNL